jgi:hypothetical protein
MIGAASAQQSESMPIQVVGKGSTKQDALNDGFRKAIEFYSGAVMLSDREIKNDKLVKNSVANYSAGYIDKYNIVGDDSMPGLTILTLEVWVRTSSMANQKLNTGKDGKSIDGNRLGTQYKTYLEDKVGAGSFLQKILNDFPKNALDIKQGEVEFKLDSKRNSLIIIPYTIKWHYNYLIALNEALGKVQSEPTYFDVTCMCSKARERVIVISKKPENFLGKRDTFYFNDDIMANQIQHTFERTNDPRVRATIYDDDQKILFTQCYPVGKTYAAKPKNDAFVVYGNESESSLIEITVPVNGQLKQDLFRASRIEVTVEPVNRC